MGWLISDTLNGRAIWHNGGTSGFGAHIGFLPGRGVGVIVLSNEQNKGFGDSVGLWVYDKLLGNPDFDYMQSNLDHAKAGAGKEQTLYNKPAAPRPPPELAALTGDYADDELGAAVLAAKEGGLVLTLKETGARLKLEPFDGAVFTVRLVAEGRFAPIVAMQGDTPIGFADFQADAEGHLTRLRWTNEGQSYLLTKRQSQ
jgi:hypothetical protein